MPLSVPPAPSQANVVDGLLYIHPGQVRVSADADRFVTILGSCVAVCLHDPALGVGGLNHFLLPSACGGAEPSPRYADTAMRRLFGAMMAHGARQERLVAHVVGGARVFAVFGSDENHLGKRNVAAGCEILARHRIPIVSYDVGGTNGRKLIFMPQQGTYTVHFIGR